MNKNSPATSSSAGPNHWAQLDAVRAFAVGLVLIDHLLIFDPSVNAFGGLISSTLRWPLPNFGYHGVQLFFFLSGFLITGILLRQQATLSPGDSWVRVWAPFMMRRIIRIFPLYYAVLAGYALAWLIWPKTLSWFGEIWPYALTYRVNVASYTYGSEVGALGHFWTLSIEEFFYLVWPLIILIVPRRQVGLMVAVIATSWAFRAYNQDLFPVGWGLLDGDVVQQTEHQVFALYSARGFIPQALMLAVGGLVAWDFRRGERARIPRPIGRLLSSRSGRLVIGLLLVACSAIACCLHPVTYDRPLVALGGWATIGHQKSALLVSEIVAYTIVIISAVLTVRHGVMARLMDASWVQRIGRISYGIYVLHMIPVYWLRQVPSYMAQPAVVRVVILLLSSYVLAEISWRVLEEPCSRLKSRWTGPGVPVPPSKGDADGSPRDSASADR
jgi:peptidoglycan/LPS O-acetylase OafA/YrhL